MSAKRCLIVDDSRSARTFLTRILQRYDLKVDGAASAEEALQYLRAEHPDVIFMDHLMPGMDGFQALSAIKSDPRTAAIPVMMYTSQEGALYVDQARALGAIGVLPKQTLPDDVNRALQQLHLLGESKPVELVRASLAPVAAKPADLAGAAVPADAADGADAATASIPAAAAGDAPLNLMTPELRAQFDALLRAHGIELRRFVAASLAQHTGQIISEVRALMDGTAPSAAAPSDAAPSAGTPVAAPPAPAEATRASRPLHGGAAALWLGALAALIALAAGLFWYQAQRQDAHLVQQPSTAQSPAPVPANPNTPAQSLAAPLAAPLAPAATPPADAATTTAPATADAAAGDAAPASTGAPMQMVESVPFGELPLAGERIASLRALLQRLAATGFRGVVEIQSFPGRFCMLADGAAPQLPAADVAYAKCAKVGNPVNYADAHSLQSPEFATLLATQAGRSRGTLDVQLVVGDAAEVASPYPAISAALTAGEWNRAAAANNRIEVRTRPVP